MQSLGNSILRQPARALQESARLFGVSFLAHAPYILIVAVYALIFAIASSYAGLPASDMTLNAFVATASVELPVIAITVLVIEFYRMVVHERPESPIRALPRRLKDFFFKDGRWAVGLPLLFILQPFIAIFADVKARIPGFNAFSWDQAFDELDRVMHFGTRPWEWLQPVLGYPLITFALNIVYNFWFLAMWMFWVWFAWQEKPGVHRTRTFLSFMLIWAIGGSLFAIAFSSAGPCFFSRLGLTPDPYAPLMSYLHEVNRIYPVWAIDTQDALWNGYANGGMLQGISAMPSMHNATTLLIVLACWHLSKFVRGLTIGLAVLIFIGSIHLGWHYAVDAYLAWAITLAVWFATKPLAVWWESRPVARRLALAVAPDAEPSATPSA